MIRVLKIHCAGWVKSQFECVYIVTLFPIILMLMLGIYSSSTFIKDQNFGSHIQVHEREATFQTYFDESIFMLHCGALLYSLLYFSKSYVTQPSPVRNVHPHSTSLITQQSPCSFPFHSIPPTFLQLAKIVVSFVPRSTLAWQAGEFP